MIALILKLFSADDDISQFIPYWDWTATTGLPTLATEYEQWKNGPVKFENRQTTRGNQPFDERFRQRLFDGVKTAYCQRNYKDFQNQIQGPHGSVHVRIGGDMRNTDYASYDPIFYMHHNNVDRQYAYYQALQKARGLSVIYASDENPPMPPFSGSKQQPQNPNNVNIPNPIKLTMDHSTPNAGLDYEGTFAYQYDWLTFDGITPENFDNSITCPQRSVKVSLSGQRSINQIVAQGTPNSKRISESFGEYVILVTQRTNTTIDVDVTSAFEKYNIDFNDPNIHFDVESLDFDGNPIENNVYKPTTEYTNPEGEKIIRYHTDYFGKYNHFLEISDLSSTVEFLKNDGTLSEGVSVVVDNNGATETIGGAFQITSTKHEFLFKGSIIQVGLRLADYLQVTISSIH